MTDRITDRDNLSEHLPERAECLVSIIVQLELANRIKKIKA